MNTRRKIKIRQFIQGLLRRIDQIERETRRRGEDVIQGGEANGVADDPAPGRPHDPRG